ncbi:MAG TPA: sulfatase-like hydrolase/transferase [Thermoanaerobaculia bacterium]|nr:sulfatase-like hydrolase/transferase [Thermoanaerobaculia bacterium]
MRGAVLLATFAFLVSCGGEAPARPPIILISIDTLRSDRLPMYGYSGVQTPALDAFRSDAVLFRNAWSHSPLTLPSHASMLTGLLPADHGVRDNTGFRLETDVPNVAAALKKNGYATGAAISAFVLRAATGINQGFDFYDDEVERARGERSLGHVQRPGDDTAAAAQQWMAARANEPFFFFLHIYEPHSPYDPPEPFASRYKSRYDGEVAHADAIIGRFLSFLKQQGIYDRALILLVSDHGEGLGDHGEEEHGIFLYREAIAVPMVIKLPGQKLAGRTVDVPVALTDVAATVLEQAGIERPESMNGRALLDDDTFAELPDRAIFSETYYPRFHFGWSELHSLVAGRDHLIDAPRAELYDLVADPREQRNVISENRRRYAALREAIQPFKQEPAAPSAISAEEAEKLAALGYIGSGANNTGPRADPKDKIETFRELQQAFRLSREEKDAEALAAFDRLLEKEPDMIDLWDVRSKTLFRLGRPAEAIESAKEALRRNPAATHIAADLANVLLVEGQLDEARKHAELALRTDPGKAHAILARVAMAQGDLARAEAEAKAALAAGGDENAALYTLATVQQKRGDFEAVLATTERLKVVPLPRGVSTMRGDAFARLGRGAEAEAAFRKELAAFPDSGEAARRLVLLLVAENRNEEATKVIRDLAAASPEAATYKLIAETLRVVGDETGVRYWSAKARQ